MHAHDHDRLRREPPRRLRPGRGENEDAGVRRFHDSEILHGEKQRDQDGGPDPREQAKALLDEVADRLAIAPQQPGHERKARAARHDAGCDEQPDVHADRAGRDRDDLHGRQMRKAGGDQYQHEKLEIAGRRIAQLFELREAAVELEHRTGDVFVGVVAEDPAEHAAEHRRDRRHHGVAIDAIDPRKAHRDEQNLGRNHEHRAFHEGDEGEPPFGALARGKRKRPVVKSSQHGGMGTGLRRVMPEA